MAQVLRGAPVATETLLHTLDLKKLLERAFSPFSFSESENTESIAQGARIMGQLLAAADCSSEAERKAVKIISPDVLDLIDLNVFDPKSFSVDDDKDFSLNDDYSDMLRHVLWALSNAAAVDGGAHIKKSLFLKVVNVGLICKDYMTPHESTHRVLYCEVMHVIKMCMIVDDEDRFREIIYDKGLIELLVKFLELAPSFAPERLLQDVLECIAYAGNFQQCCTGESEDQMTRELLASGDSMEVTFDILEAFKELGV